MEKEVEQRTKDPTAEKFLEEIKYDNNSKYKKKIDTGEKTIIKKATIMLTEKEYTMMQIADINISQICSKLLKNYLNSRSVQDNVKQKLGIINDYFSK